MGICHLRKTWLFNWRIVKVPTCEYLISMRQRSRLDTTKVGHICLRVIGITMGWCWWDTVDGQNPAPVEVGSLPHYLPGFNHPRWCRISSINSITSSDFFFDFGTMSGGRRSHLHSKIIPPILRSKEIRVSHSRFFPCRISFPQSWGRRKTTTLNTKYTG